MIERNVTVGGCFYGTKADVVAHRVATTTPEPIVIVPATRSLVRRARFERNKRLMPSARRIYPAAIAAMRFRVVVNERDTYP